MKKFTIMLAALALAVPAFAQQNQEPNRLLLTNTIGNRQGYVINRVQDITFARVEGEVKTDIDIKEVTCDSIVLSLTRTEACSSFLLDVVPSTIANAYDDLAMITYLERKNVPTFYEDYSNGVLSGIELKPASEYTVVTVGIDNYGVKDGVCRANVTTPAIPVVGNPQIQAEVVDRQTRSFSVKFTPNEDVLEYYCVAGEKGTMQSQYEMFGPMMGFANFTDLIISWGLCREGETVAEWTNMAPGEEYEVFYVALDQNGNPAPYQVLETSTLSLGGEGEASVAVELGEYVLAEWDGELKPSQYITFTPNDQSQCYRFGVYKANVYDEQADAIKAELCSEPPMPMAYWFFYEPMTTDFQIDPEVEAVAIAAAKNANNEWGPVTEVRFTTPSEAGDPEYAPAKSAANSPIKARFKARKQTSRPGMAPVMAKPQGLRLR